MRGVARGPGWAADTEHPDRRLATRLPAELAELNTLRAAHGEQEFLAALDRGALAGTGMPDAHGCRRPRKQTLGAGPGSACSRRMAPAPLHVLRRNGAEHRMAASVPLGL
jgi:hypothetical protein